MVASTGANHAAAQVYVNGHWVMLCQQAGTFADMCTHEQLIQLMSGVQVKEYKTWDYGNGTDLIISLAKTSPQRVSDLRIDARSRNHKCRNSKRYRKTLIAIFVR